MPHDIVTLDEPMTERPEMRAPDVGELAAASWGGSWLPSDQMPSGWREPEDQDSLDERFATASDAWDLWPIFERFGQSLRLLISS